MSFFVEKLGPLPNQQTSKEQKSAAGADLLKHPSKAGQPAKGAPPRAQPERAAQQAKVVDRAPPPKDDPKKKKGWFN